MSSPSPSPLPNESPTPSHETDSKRDSDSSAFLESLKGPAQFAAFWAAVTLPFVLVTLLSQGLDQTPVALAFLVLLVANVVALYVGHGYNQR